MNKHTITFGPFTGPGVKEQAMQVFEDNCYINAQQLSDVSFSFEDPQLAIGFYTASLEFADDTLTLISE